jgi:hypothetical protein
MTVLSADDHRDIRVLTGRGAHLGDAQMACLIVPDEFRRLATEFPILFRPNATRDRIDAYALMGFENGENLFLTGDRWDARYVPMAMDSAPLQIGHGPAGAQVHLDLAHPRIATGDEGIRLFDDLGRPSPWLEAAIQRLGQFDAGFVAMPDFIAALRRYDLLEPTTIEVTLNDGSTNRLVGYHAVNEEKLRALDGPALGELHAAGHLMPLFMAVASLGNIGKLVARKNG